MLRKSERSIAQVRENVLAILRWHELPPPQIVGTLPDRVLFASCHQFRDRLLERAQAGAFRPWPFYSNHGTTAVRSWREDTPWASLQIVEHATGSEIVQFATVLEMDIDLCNPDAGVAPALGHLVEALWPGKTDPFRSRKWIMRRGIAVPLVE